MITTKTIAFWQPVISSHYASLFINLVPFYEVILFVEKEIAKERLLQGWSVPDLPGVKTIKVSHQNYRSQFDCINNEQTVHIFSGTRAYPNLWRVLKFANKKKARIALMGETMDWLGWKGQLRLLLSTVDRFILSKNLIFILAIGESGVRWYNRVGYSKDAIFEWAYFISPMKKADIKLVGDKTNVTKFIYVGRLSQEKGVNWLISTLLSLVKFPFELHIIGDGIERDKLVNLIPVQERHKFIFHGTIKNSEIYPVLMDMDYLVLPSVGKDGWGAVVNEAFNVGLPCIVSTYAGASCLIKNEPILGYTVNPALPQTLLDVLEGILKDELKPTVKERECIIEFAQNISGEAAALYLKNIIQYVDGFTEIKPYAPWKSHLNNKF